MRIRLLAPLCALALPLGCSLFQTIAASGFQNPTLAFKDAQLAEVSLEGATVNLVVSVDNPNSQGISLAETDYQLQIEGNQLVAGKPPAGITIPANGKMDVTLPATVKFSELGSSLAALFSKHTVGYAASGHLGIQTPIGILALPIEKQGQLDLPRVPEVSLGSPSLKNISLTSATLDLPLVLKNPNAFALPLGAVAGALTIAGVEIGSVKTKEVGRVAASASQTISLPVQIRFADAYAAFKALQQGSVHIGFNGELRSGGAALPFKLEQDVDVAKEAAEATGAGGN